MTVGIVASAHVEPAGGGTGLWVNHVAIAAPRNATNTHTVNPNSGTTATGTLFTPTAGRLLVVVAEGAVTSTTPSGWTLEASAIDNTGLYCWSRTAAGSDTLTTTHNGSNYPVGFHWFEFATGSTWGSDVSSTAVAAAGANPNLTGLTGTNLVMAAKASGLGGSVGTVTGVWDSPNVEILDTFALQAATDGYWLSIGYQTGYTSASYQPTCTRSSTGAPAVAAVAECLTWAVHAL